MPEISETEPLLDPDCRDGKCGSCVGEPCECRCHVTAATKAEAAFWRAKLEEAERRLLPGGTAPVTAEPCCDVHIAWLCEDTGPDAQGPCCPRCPSDPDVPPTIVIAAGEPAPVTAENLRERIAWLRDRWYQRPGLSEQADALDAALDEFAKDAVDPGDLPARMAEAIRRHDPDAERGLVNGQAYCVCGDLVEDWNEHWATAALSVRWKDHAATVAENAQLRAHAEHTEAELSSRIGQHQRAVNRATAAEGEAERLRAELANRDKLIEKYRETVGVVVGQREEAKAELDDMEGVVTDLGVVRLELQAAIERVKRYLDGIEAHCSANRMDVPSWVRSIRAALDGGQ